MKYSTVPFINYYGPLMMQHMYELSNLWEMTLLLYFVVIEIRHVSSIFNVAIWLIILFFYLLSNNYQFNIRSKARSSGKIKHILSVIHYTIYGTVCFQFSHLPFDDWENIYFVLLSSSNRKYELLLIV